MVKQIFANFSDDFAEVVGDEVNGELDSPLRNHFVARETALRGD